MRVGLLEVELPNEFPVVANAGRPSLLSGFTAVSPLPKASLSSALSAYKPLLVSVRLAFVGVLPGPITLPPRTVPLAELLMYAVPKYGEFAFILTLTPRGLL